MVVKPSPVVRVGCFPQAVDHPSLRGLGLEKLKVGKVRSCPLAIFT